MNPNLAQELLAADIDYRFSVACRRRLAAAAAPPAALRRRWGVRLIALGEAIARDPHLLQTAQLGREVDRGARSLRSSSHSVRSPRCSVGS